MDAELKDLQSKQIAMDKDLAVCIDRLSRNENDVQKLSREVSSTLKSVQEIKNEQEAQNKFNKSQFEALSVGVTSLSANVMENTKSNNEVKTAYQTVVKVFSICSAVALFVGAIGKYAGVW